MKVKVYNLEGKETGDMNLSETVFGVKSKPEIVHEVFVALQNNQREPWADTKNRGEVRGGGKKPWQQKGTGRARHGSIRSPIWKGGGVTFGPLSIRN
jgi:large subunit ribosomal protein L4